MTGFYSRTGRWWGPGARVDDRDRERVALLHEHAGAGPGSVLELGSGYGTTAVATALAGHTVTAVEISDRVAFGAELAAGLPPGRLTVHNESFYTVRLGEQYDAVTYWNGFGVGSDADQRRLLTLVAGWLRPGATALIDVFNPLVWASWHGQHDQRLPDPARGYHFEVRQLTVFDPVTSTATDTWWQADRPDERISQVLRCYSPADLELLLEGTGLRLAAIDDRGRDMRTQAYEYLAVLRHTPG